VRWTNQQGETVQAQAAAISKSPNQTIRGRAATISAAHSAGLFLAGGVETVAPWRGGAAILNPGRSAQKLLEDDFGIGPPC